jgi:hypothetical protein|tara:strand:- start:109 stop:762 length:654 start_codon:yes stop_codon:yes gene_type:complete
MAVLTKDNVMQARYTNPEQDTISILFVDHDAEGKARANYEIFCQAGDQQHKELHAAGWDHAAIEKETVEWIKDSHRQAGEALLGHEATKIIDEKLRATKEALAEAVAAYKETRKINDATKEKIEENAGELKERTKEVYLKRNKETARMIALYIYENNKDRECVDILAHMTSRKGYSLLEILAQCTPEGGAGPDNPIKDMGHDDLLKKELKWKTLDWK